jgi:hypothetical protein
MLVWPSCPPQSWASVSGRRTEGGVVTGAVRAAGDAEEGGSGAVRGVLGDGGVRFGEDGVGDGGREVEEAAEVRGEGIGVDVERGAVRGRVSLAKKSKGCRR